MQWIPIFQRSTRTQLRIIYLNSRDGVSDGYSSFFQVDISQENVNFGQVLSMYIGDRDMGLSYISKL